MDLCRKAVSAGVSWITVHGRTPPQRCQPVNVDAIRIIADSLQVPVIANGDIRSVAGADDIRRQTGVTGVWMALKTSYWLQQWRSLFSRGHLCFSMCVCSTTVTATICGDACPLSCASAEAYKLAQCTRPQG